MTRATRIVAALAVLLLLGLAWAAPGAAQDAGDQIVDPAATPAANEAPEVGDVTPTQDDQPTQDTDAADDADDANSAETDDESAADDAEGDADTAATDDIDATTSTTAGGLLVIEDLNLRSEANVDSDIITVMPAGSVVTLAGEGEVENDFLPVAFEGETGWGYLPYLVDEAQGDNLAIVTTELNLRSGPSIEDDILTVMPAGAEVRVVDSATDADGDSWNRVLYEGDIAWALATYVEFAADMTDAGDTGDTEDTAASATSGGLVTTTDLNLRGGPSLDDEVLSVISAGVVVAVDGDAANGFVPVTIDGVAGWLSTDFVAPADAAADPTQSTSTTTNGQTRITLADLNLRAGPSTDDAALLVVPEGEVVTLTPDGAANGYVTVTYQGTAGWTLAEFLQE